MMVLASHLTVAATLLLIGNIAEKRWKNTSDNNCIIASGMSMQSQQQQQQQEQEEKAVEG